MTEAPEDKKEPKEPPPVIPELTKEEMENARRVVEDEGIEGYRRGGYHPVFIGDKYCHGRYIVVSKVGWGHFSTVWRAYDTIDGRYVALKIVKSAPQYAEAAKDEILIMERVTGYDPENKSCCLHLLNSFFHLGPNGQHTCMVFELLGSNLLDLIKLYGYQGIPMPAVKYITGQILKALDYLHKKCGVIHTDIKPENILLCETITDDQYLPSNNPEASAPHHTEAELKEGEAAVTGKMSFEQLYKVKIADFGNANWVKLHFTDDIQTRQYRSPEVIIGASWNCTVDVWSVACMVFELLTGDFLFEPKSGSGFEKEDDHLAQMIELLGPIPPVLIVLGKYSDRYFTRHGALRHIRKEDLRPWALKPLLIDKYHFSESAAESTSSFLSGMLEYLPENRKEARAMLSHPWLTI